MDYFLFFTLAFILSVILTKIVRHLALKYKILDYPEKTPERKIHKTPTPLLGGLAIFSAFFLVLFLGLWFNFFSPEEIKFKHLVGLFIAGLILMAGGFLDDKYHLKPSQQIIWPVAAALVVIAAGISIKYVNNPFGSGLLFLEQYKIEILKWQGILYYLTLPADLITFTWLFIMAYATKLLDGLDGLVSGITGLGGLVIFGLCLLTKFYQPEVGTLAIILAGASFGFLIFNFHPAKIFLGEGGSLWTGFMLGGLAIISGSKIATLLLVLGIPVLDVIWVVLRRIFVEHHLPFTADKKHLHFRLLDLGLSHQQAVIFLWGLALIFGLIGLFFPVTKIKIFVLITLVIVMIILAIFLTNQKIFKKIKKKTGLEK